MSGEVSSIVPGQEERSKKELKFSYSTAAYDYVKNWKSANPLNLF